MTAVTKAGAASLIQVNWHDINWQKVYRNVRRLQARIVKATKEGRWNKVKSLQRLLTHSFSGKVLAIRRVTETQGKNTPGVDGAIWNTPIKKAKALQSLKQRGYKTKPLRRIYRTKKNGKKRPLGIPTMRDRAMQRLYSFALEPIAETTADPNSYGFRVNRSTADAMRACFSVLATRNRATWILEGDIKSCFDQISHKWILQNIPIDKKILKKWLKSGFMDKQSLYPTKMGVPQGGNISPIIANMVLDGIETELKKAFPSWKGKKVNYVRYADDWVITGISKEILENEVKPIVEKFLQERGLELSYEKTKITNIEEGFDFLGQNVRKYKGKILIKPSKNNTKSFLREIRDTIKSNKAASSGRLINILNPKIRGWAQFHRHAASKKTFSKVDHAIFQAIWKWAKRRHSTKKKTWIKNKYFKPVKGYSWTFFGEIKENEIYLFRASTIPIRRHIKIKAKANPFDPEWETYFEKRITNQMMDKPQARNQIIKLWKDQKGLCPICGETITSSTGWRIHYTTWLSKGGKEQQQNRALLHPDCHLKVHKAKSFR
jgi:RNA-directed DNA polymerase